MSSYSVGTKFKKIDTTSFERPNSKNKKKIKADELGVTQPQWLSGWLVHEEKENGSFFYMSPPEQQ